VYTAAFQWEGSTELPDNAAWVFTFNSGALRTLTSSFFVSPNSSSSGEGLLFLPYIGDTPLSPKTFPVIQSYDPNDLNSIEAAYKQGYYPGQLQGQEDRIVIGGEQAVTAIYIQVLARSELLPDQQLFINVNALFEIANPIPGVSVTPGATLNTGGAPGPTPTPEPSPPTITNIFPDTLAIPVPSITNITIKGLNFPTGGALPTIEIIGDAIGGPIVATALTADETTVTAEVFNPAVAPGVSFDVLVIFNDGTSANLNDGINS
jgi:hypothetical protein